MLRVLIGAALVLTAIASIANAAEADARVSAVLLTPVRPVIVRLTITVDGRSLEQFRAEFCRQAFRRLDKDRDGALTPEEAEKPTSDEASKMASAASKPASPPQSKRLTLEEFAASLRKTLGEPLLLNVKKATGDDADALFPLLDRNADGRLEIDELRQARSRLAPLDADDDETISVEEIKAAAPGSAGKSARGGFHLLKPGEPLEPLARNLIATYGRPGSTLGDLDLKSVGSGWPDVAAFDRDRNGRLSLAECVEWLRSSPPSADVSIELFDRERGSPKAAVTRHDASHGVTSGPAEDSATLRVGGYGAVLRAKRTRGAESGKRQFYLTRFRVADRDRNGYLDAKEYPRLGLTGVELKAIDRDGNGQLSQSELADHLHSGNAGERNVVAMDVTEDAASLFDRLDRRADRRLSPRELAQAESLLTDPEVDRDRDGALSRMELSRGMAIEVEANRPPLPAQMMMAAPRPRTGAQAVPRDEGPPWFGRMDRNYDGDVSWREFLGDRPAFDRLDIDRDGLLSADEATAAK